MEKFILHSEYKPTGDQPEAIQKLVDGFKEGNNYLVSGSVCELINIDEFIEELFDEEEKEVNIVS